MRVTFASIMLVLGGLSVTRVAAQELAFKSLALAQPPVIQHFAQPPVVDTAAQTETFWLVSSRHSPQSFDNGRPYCPLEFFRCDGTKTLKRVSVHQFRAGIIPHVPVCLQVHGSFVDFETSYYDAAETVKWLRRGLGHQPAQMVFFTWPSERNVSLVPQIDVAVLGRQAARNGFYVLDLLNNMPTNTPVCLLGHSHGARLTASLLHLRAGGAVQGLKYDRPIVPRRIRTILASAALDHHWLNPGERYDRSLYATESLLNIRNRSDCTLKIYALRKPFGRRALTISGFTSSDRLALGSPGAKIREIDVSKQLRHGHKWPRFYEKPHLAMLIIPSLQF